MTTNGVLAAPKNLRITAVADAARVLSAASGRRVPEEQVRSAIM